jgi:phosphoribosyl-AMP cyclohydrolase / phosphoribosyl-ATP pyrophosphohydrolase
MMNFKIDELDWSKQQGLVPAIVQDVDSLQVLMLGFMNREALIKTVEEGRLTF